MLEVGAVFMDAKGSAVFTADLEVAVTDEERRVGLSGRLFIPDYTGMLFKPATYFWMRDTYVPLDLIFIKNGYITTVFHMHPQFDVPDDDLKVYGVGRDVSDYAIELPMGNLEEGGSGEGCKVILLEQK